MPAVTLESGTSYNFKKGGYVMCLTPTNVTLWASNSAAKTVFNNFVGVLPVLYGCDVTTSQTAYFGA